jgi:predicted enzyme related to lactoylglutathione lyase
MQSLFMNKLISWFEIPALDLKRASAFYQQIFGVTFRGHQLGADDMVVFPYDREHATGGCVISGERYKPSADGAVVYLETGDSLEAVLARVEPAGGQVAVPRTALPPGMGAFAHILDTEGNRVGLHGN